MLNHRYTRDDNEAVIGMLCAHFPKTFFENPRQRRPLKKNIVSDIIKDESFDVAPEAIDAAVGWYESNIGMDYAMAVVGAQRIDLNGKEVERITEAEAAIARQNVATKGKAIERRRSPIEVLHKMHADGLVTDCGVKKMDAIPTTRTKSVSIAPEFAALYETLAAANSAVIGVSDPVIRLAVARAVIDEVIRKAEQVKQELAG